MIDYTDVVAFDDLPDGQISEFTVKGQQIILVRRGEEVYAAAARCPHLGGRLAKGKLEGTVIQCPLHGSRFDVKDGSVNRWLQGKGLIAAIGRVVKRPRALAVYPVKVADGRVLVRTM